MENLERERQKAIKEKDHELEVILEQYQVNSQEKQEEAESERKLVANLNEVQKGKLEALRRVDEEREKDDRAVIAIDLKDISDIPHLKSIFTPYNTEDTSSTTSLT